MWTIHGSLLCDVLTSAVLCSGEPLAERNSQAIGQVLLDNFSDIKRRNEAMLFSSFPVDMSAGLGTAVTDIKVKTYFQPYLKFPWLMLDIQDFELYLQQDEFEQPTILLTFSR